MFCTIWMKDPAFNDTILAQNKALPKASIIKQLQMFLCKLRNPLKRLNKDRFVDIYAEQTIANDKLSGLQ